MAWFAYISNKCREAAQEHGVLPSVEKLKETVEELQQDCLSRFDQFPPPYLVKKKFADKAGRLIAERREIRGENDEHTVIVFLDFMTRGNPDYENGFGKEPVAYGKKHYDGLVQEGELEEYILKTRTKIQEPPKPSNFEYGYLHAALGTNYEDRSDGYIYESTEWNETINQRDFVICQSQIFEKLSGFLTPAAEFGPRRVQISVDIVALGYYFPKDKIYFFAGLGDSTVITRLQNKYDAVFSSENSAETLARYACRAYPAIVLAGDLYFWSNIEKKGSGNMALSPEETQLLQSVECSPNGAYPLFINGRAGSGKSTILQYLFSYYMEYYLKHRGSAGAESRPLPPLYLTWSTMLLETARKNVEAFLKCSTRNLGKDEQQVTDRDIENTFSGAFRSFQSFMLEQIPLKERVLFKPDRHISYVRFVEMWRDKFGNEQEICKLGPEICWHIIRTFIKGTDIEDFLEPEDYLVGLRKEQTVSRQNYELVFKNVWEKWYRELTVGVNDEPGPWWDDQDLIRYVIRHNYCNLEYPVVFCDEAQDFTRIELNAILNLSLFSHRKIHSYEVSQLPFAFAGDPFQTLNPTGFRWEAIKNSFVEQFINSHHRGVGGRTPELNYCELENNYRSDAAIVKFSNNVQLLRSKVLQQNILPQKPWWEGRTGNVAYFDKKDSSFRDWVKKHPEVVFVVPCDRDGEEAYWKSSGMNSFVRFSDVTVMSTIAIKGLEYSTIVVCGFGDQSPAVLKQYWGEACGDETDGASDNKLTVEYFINKLYVAVSRAQKRLLILDSDKGREKLWSLFMSNDFNAQQDDKLYLRLQLGDVKTLERDDQAGSSPQDEADHFFADGKSQRSPYLIRRAKKLYGDAGMKPQAANCEAWALFFEAKYHEAAEADREDANYTLKHRCWWLEGTTESLQKIIDSQDKNSDFLTSEEFRLLNRCRHSGSLLLEVLDVLNDVYSVYTQAGKLFELENATPAWKLLVGGLFGSGNLFDNLADDVKVRVWDLLEKFRQFGLVTDSIAGRLAFQCSHFGKAVEWLKDEKEPGLIDIRKKAEQQAKPLEAQVQSAFTIRDWEAVVKLHRENPDASFSYHSMVQIAIASAVQGDSFVAEKLFRTQYSSGLLTALLEEKEISKEVIKKLEADNLRAMVAYCDYPAISNFLNRKSFTQEQVIFFIRLFARCDAASFQNNASELLPKITAIIVNFLKKCKKGTLEQYFFEIGCALEKANRIKDAKEFYLDKNQSLCATDQQEALRRALVCYERHAEVIDEERSKHFQLRKAEELRKKLGLDGVKRGDSRLPEYKFGVDPWFDFENLRSLASAEESQSGLSEKKPTAVAAVPPVPVEKPVPPAQKPSHPKHEDVPLGSLDVVESGGSEDLVELTQRGEELFAQLTTAGADFFPLREEKIDELLIKSQLLVELCRKLLRGDGSEEWQSVTGEADSFAALREVLTRRVAEQQARERRKEFLAFLNDLGMAVGRLELKPITNKRQKKRAEDDLFQIKQAISQATIEFSEEHPLPSNWSPLQDASEWLRENLLVEPEQLDEERIQTVLPFNEDTCEKLLEWHDKLILP